MFRPLPSLALVAVLLSVTVTAIAEDEWDGVSRIVAIGDIHGDYGQFTTLLRQAGLIDESATWTGGETHLVQTGDVPDRGPDTRRILDLLITLEKQARKAGGYVHALIGNHEAMNMMGALRYVTPEEFASFATNKSGKLRQRQYKAYVSYLEANPPEDGLPAFDAAFEEQWMAEHPLGFFEHRDAFAPTGTYGRWIARHNAAVRINNTLFLHGGISPKYADIKLRDLNKLAQKQLSADPIEPGGIVDDDQGPLWYRGLALHPEPEERAHVDAVLERFGVEHIVLGHTVTVGAVTPRFGGKVILNDNGMAAAYGGRLACVVIEDGSFYALHRGERLPMPIDSNADLLEYFRAAAELDPQPSPLAETISNLAAAVR